MASPSYHLMTPLTCLYQGLYINFSAGPQGLSKDKEGRGVEFQQKPYLAGKARKKTFYSAGWKNSTENILRVIL